MRPISFQFRRPHHSGPIPSIITSIRQLPSGVSPTLDSIPEINHAMLLDEPLPCMIRDMQQSDFKRWGFVVFRTAYTEESQPLWESYVEFLKGSVEGFLEVEELSTLLKPLLEWTIIEDRETLGNASKQHVRERFSEWVSQRSVERDGPGVEEAFQRDFPRFRYCIYVDQKCLDTVAQYQAWVEAGAQGIPKEIVCVILDKKCKPKGQGQCRFPRIEGCSREYTGWQYTDLCCITYLYDRLAYRELVDVEYTRPPKIYPSDKLMPLN